MKSQHQKNFYQKSKFKAKRTCFKELMDNLDDNYPQQVKMYSKKILTNSDILMFQNHLMANYFWEPTKSKFKKLANKKGSNKGKKSYCSSHQKADPKFQNFQDINYPEIYLINIFKKNKREQINPEKPICEICCYNNVGKHQYFRECGHSKLFCSCCAKKMFSCPYCRIHR